MRAAFAGIDDGEVILILLLDMTGLFAVLFLRAKVCSTHLL